MRLRTENNVNFLACRLVHCFKKLKLERWIKYAWKVLNRIQYRSDSKRKGVLVKSRVQKLICLTCFEFGCKRSLPNGLFNNSKESLCRHKTLFTHACEPYPSVYPLHYYFMYNSLIIVEIHWINNDLNKKLEKNFV